MAFAVLIFSEGFDLTLIYFTALHCAAVNNIVTNIPYLDKLLPFYLYSTKFKAFVIIKTWL